MSIARVTVDLEFVRNHPVMLGGEGRACLPHRETERDLETYLNHFPSGHQLEMEITYHLNKPYGRKPLDIRDVNITRFDLPVGIITSETTRDFFRQIILDDLAATDPVELAEPPWMPDAIEQMEHGSSWAS